MVNMVLLVPLDNQEAVETVDLLVTLEYKGKLEHLAGMEPLDFRDQLDLVVCLARGEMLEPKDT